MSTQQVARAPDFIDPISLDDLSDEQIDQMLDVIRERRMQKLYVYQETRALQELANEQRLGETLRKKLNKAAKLFISIDGSMAKLEQVILEIRGIRLQLGQDPL